MGERQGWKLYTSCRQYEQRRHIAAKTVVFRDQSIGLLEGIAGYITRKVVLS